MAGIPPFKNSGKIQYREKLSNSGDTLKLLILNYSRKAISGWSNYSGMVTSQKIDEKKMGNRGSKSDLNTSNKSKSVKEQRVDGSCFGYKPKLRCTLTGCESCYPFKIPSKQLKNKRTFSTLNIQPNFNPWFVTGLSDAEGSFIVRISKNTKNKRTKIGWIVSSNFQITLHQRDFSLLLMLQQFFGGIGKINIDPKRESSKYTIIKLNDLKNVIIPHFEKYPLLTQKYADFCLFQRVLEIISNKNHLSIEGLQKIINIKAAMNKGLSKDLKSNFFNINIVDRPVILTKNIVDNNWIAGFVSGEGNFDINIHN